MSQTANLPIWLGDRLVLSGHFCEKTQEHGPFLRTNSETSTCPAQLLVKRCYLGCATSCMNWMRTWAAAEVALSLVEARYGMVGTTLDV